MIDSNLRGLLQVCVVDNPWPEFQDLLETMGLHRGLHNLATMLDFIEGCVDRERVYQALERRMQKGGFK